MVKIRGFAAVLGGEERLSRQPGLQGSSPLGLLPKLKHLSSGFGCSLFYIYMYIYVCTHTLFIYICIKSKMYVYIYIHTLKIINFYCSVHKATVSNRLGNWDEADGKVVNVT